MWLEHTFRVNAQFAKSKVALKQRDKSITYGELDLRTNALYRYFQDVGVQQGDRVAVLSKNSIEVIETFVCCYKNGLIFVPLNYRLTPDKIDYILSDSGANVLVVSNEFAGLANSDQLNTNGLKTIIVTTEPILGMQFYDELVSEPVLGHFETNVKDTDPGAIIYTSGTTGYPKGVILSHRALLEVSKNYMLELGIQSTDRTLNVMPLVHQYRCRC